MSDVTYAALIILMFFVIIYWIYGQMVVTIVRWSKKPRKSKKTGKMVQPHLSAGEVVRCYIPLYQVSYMRLWLYGSATLYNVLCTVCAVCLGLRALNMFVPINSYVMFATVIIGYLGVLLHILIYAIATAAAIKLYGFGWPTIILSFIFPHFIAFFMKSSIPNKMVAMQKEDVFSEHKTDTYIKQRSHK